MRKIIVEDVILRDEGKIQLNCSCCGRPNNLPHKDVVVYLKFCSQLSSNGYWECFYENCEAYIERGGKVPIETFNRFTDNQVKQILSFRLKEDLE